MSHADNFKFLKNMRVFKDFTKLVFYKYETGFLHYLTSIFNFINFHKIINCGEPFDEQ